MKTDAIIDLALELALWGARFALQWGREPTDAEIIAEADARRVSRPQAADLPEPQSGE